MPGEILQLKVAVGYMQSVNLPAIIGPALKENGIDSDEVIYVVGFGLTRVMATIFSRRYLRLYDNAPSESSRSRRRRCSAC